MFQRASPASTRPSCQTLEPTTASRSSASTHPHQENHANFIHSSPRDHCHARCLRYSADHRKRLSRCAAGACESLLTTRDRGSSGPAENGMAAMLLRSIPAEGRSIRYGVVAYRTSNPFSIVEQREGEMTTLYLKFVPSSALGSAVLGSATFVLMADFQKTAECNAEVSARGWNEGWQRAAAQTSVWLESPQSRGTDLNCKE